MSKALGGWLKLLFCLLLLVETQSGHAASFSLPTTSYSVTSGPVSCTGGVCTATLGPPGRLDLGTTLNSNNTVRVITELQSALLAVPGSIDFFRRSLDDMTFNATAASALNNVINGSAIFVSDTTATRSSFPADPNWDGWLTGNFNSTAITTAGGAGKDVGNAVDVTFPAAALMGSPLYDVFVRDDGSNALAAWRPQPEDSFRLSQPNTIVSTSSWEGFFLVPPGRPTGDQANRGPASFYDRVLLGGTAGLQQGGTDRLQQGGTDGYANGTQWAGTDRTQWGQTDGLQWAGSTPAIPGSNVSAGVPGTPGAVSPSWPPSWP